MKLTLSESLRGCSSALLLLTSSQVSGLELSKIDPLGYAIAEPLPWVEPIDYFDLSIDPNGDGQNGYRQLVSDVQVDARTPGQLATYRMKELKLTGSRGVENLSQL